MSETTHSSNLELSLPFSSLPGFVRLQWHALSSGAAQGDLSACIIDFDTKAFAPIAFRLALIACPSDIASSVPKRQAEYFFGRLAARSALAPLGYARFEVYTGSMREPVWPEGVVGSISHSCCRAVAVATSKQGLCGIGLDIEGPLDAAELEALRDTVIDDTELALIAFAPMHESTALRIVFSAKESLFKAVSANVGRYFGFEAARLSDFDVERQRVWFQIRENLCPALYPGIICGVDFCLLHDGSVLTSFAC